MITLSQYAQEVIILKNEQVLFCGNNEKFLDKELCKDSNENNGGTAFRIPSLVNANGVLIAAIDKASSGADWGYIEVAIRRSEDGGKTWSKIESILVPPARETKIGDEYYTSAFYIDPCMTVAKNGDIVMLVTYYPECKGLHNQKLLDKKKAAYTSVDGKMTPIIYDKEGNFYTVRENGIVYDKKGEKTNYTVKTKTNAPYYEIGDLYRDKEYMGNIYLNGAMGAKEIEAHLTFGAPLKTPKRSYIFMTKSSDQGKTWSEPKDITGDILLKSDSTFLGVAPGNGIALKDGRLVFTVYTLRGGSASIYSDDNGKTWKRDTTQKYIGIPGEWQCVEAPTGEVIGLSRQNFSGKTPMAISYNNGVTWEKKKKTKLYACKCQKSFIKYDDTYVLSSHTCKKARKDGVLSIGKFKTKNGKTTGIKWLKNVKINEGFFAYSSLTVLDNGNVGILYEDSPSSHIVYKEFEKNELFSF